MSCATPALPSNHLGSASCLLPRKWTPWYMELVYGATQGASRNQRASWHSAEGFFLCHVLPVAAAPPLATQAGDDMLSVPGV